MELETRGCLLAFNLSCLLRGQLSYHVLSYGALMGARAAQVLVVPLS